MSLRTPPIRIPVIYHGKDSLEHLKTFRENRIFIVTDKIARKMFGDKLLSLLAGKEVAFFDEVEPNPKDTIMAKAGELARSFKPELIIGIGGGSVMDTAKASYFLYGQPALNLTDLENFKSYRLKDKSKLVLVPTTSGTGSESSSGLVFTSSTTGKKTDVISLSLIPWGVIIDPMLPLSMPRQLTIASGIDALAQAIESMCSPMINDFLQAFNFYGIKLLFRYLPKAANEGANETKIRQKVHYASSMIGIAMGNAGLGIGHACGHALGGAFDIPHGITVGLMLPYYIEYNKAQSSKRYTEILESLNVTGADDPAAKLSAMVKDLLATLNLPLSVKALGINPIDWEQNLEKMVEFAAADICLMTNPRPTGEEELKKIFRYAYEEKTIDF